MSEFHQTAKIVEDARKIVKNPISLKRNSIKTRIDEINAQIEEINKDERYIHIDINQCKNFLRKYQDDYDYRNLKIQQQLYEKERELSRALQKITLLEHELESLSRDFFQLQNNINEVDSLSEDAILQQAYALLCEKKEKATDAKAFMDLASAFRSLTGHLNSDRLASECDDEIQRHLKKQFDDNKKRLKEIISNITNCRTENEYIKLKNDLADILNEFNVTSTSSDVQQLVSDTKKAREDCDNAIERCRLQMRFDKNDTKLKETISQMHACTTEDGYQKLKSYLVNILTEFNAIATNFDVGQSISDAKKGIEDCDSAISMYRQKERQKQRVNWALGCFSFAASALFITLAFFDWFNVLGNGGEILYFLFGVDSGLNRAGGIIGIGVLNIAYMAYSAIQFDVNIAGILTALLFYSILMMLPMMINLKHCTDILRKRYITGSTGMVWCGILITIFIVFESGARFNSEPIELTIIPWALLVLSVLNCIICEINRRKTGAFIAMFVILSALLGFSGFKGWLMIPELSIHSDVFSENNITQTINQNPGLHSETNPTPTIAPTQNSLTSFPGTLARGSSGDDVLLIQNYLNSVGEHYSDIPQLVADGSFGPKTEAAVKVFQEQFGLFVDGVVDERTWKSIVLEGS